MRLHALVLSVALLLFGIVYTAPHEQAYAQSEVTGPAMGTALAAVVEATLEARGYSLTDAVVTATLAAISAEAASVAATVASGAGVAASGVSWIAVGAAAGLGAVLGAVPTTLGDDSLQAWQFNSNGTVTVSQLPGSGGSGGAFPALTAGGTYYVTQGADGPIYGGSPAAAAAGYIQDPPPSWAVDGLVGTAGACNASGGSSYSCEITVTENGNPYSSGFLDVVEGQGWNMSACSSGMYYSGACQSNAAASSAPVTESATAAAASAPSSDDSDGLNPVILAALANALWEQAADQSGYTGVPYSASSPVTSSQASSAESSLGTSAPTVGSAVSPAGSLTGASSSSPFGVTSPGTSTGASTGTSTGTSTGSSGTTGTGTDGTPDLCQLDPTAAACATLGSASAPALPTSSVSVSLSPVSVGGPSNATCPASVPVVVFGQTLYFDYTPLCNLVIGLQPLVLALCGLGAGLIVVSGLKS